MARVFVLAAVALMVLTACNGGGDTVSVRDAWGRTSPSGATNAAFYMTIDGGSSDDTLVGGNADACGDTQLHQSMMTDGVMSMQHLPDGIFVAAGKSVNLEPGSFHVMCIDTRHDLVAGESIDLTLEFAVAGSMDVSVEIRDQ